MTNLSLHSQQKFSKRVFDVTSKEDLRIYKQFVDSNGWGETGCPFKVEWPHVSVPDMISKKISYHYISKI